MGQGRVAQTLSDTQFRALLRYVAEETSYPGRNRVMLLLSFKAGLRSKEIAMARWRMVLDVEGRVSTTLRLENAASKGRSGRPVILHEQLRDALVDLYHTDPPRSPDDFIVRFQKAASRVTARANSTQWLLKSWYRALGYHGASSHSGRRTFITNLARRISAHGGSLRDVQVAAGHSRLDTTQRYIDVNSDALVRAIQSL